MRIRGPEPALAEVDMTPMIDIVFQLIAFFMVISNFEQTKADERVKLAKDALAQPSEVKIEHELALNIGFNRDREGNKIDPDPYVFFAGESIPIPQFGPKFDQEARLYDRTGVDPEDVTVVFRADQDVPTGMVQELMRMAQEVRVGDKPGFSKFIFKARQSTDGN